MRVFNRSLVLATAGWLSAGCQISITPGQFALNPPVVEQTAVEAPVITAPGVEVIDVEPDPAYRVYVYDPGYPPGAYLYNDYYWYNGYRYPHDVFVNQYVNVNIRENRFTDVEENRRSGQRIEAQHRAEYARTGGVRTRDQHPGQRIDRSAPHSQPTPAPAKKSK